MLKETQKCLLQDNFIILQNYNSYLYYKNKQVVVTKYVSIRYYSYLTQFNLKQLVSFMKKNLQTNMTVRKQVMTQIKYSSILVVSNPKQGFDIMHQCAKYRDPSKFYSGMSLETNATERKVMVQFNRNEFRNSFL